MSNLTEIEFKTVAYCACLLSQMTNPFSFFSSRCQ